MSSSSPGHVMPSGDPEGGPQATVDGVRAPAQTAASPMRAATQKRARGSPSSPAHARALALIGNLTDTVRTGAVRGLRALTDSIDRSRGDVSASESTDSVPPSPTDALMSAQTPRGKRRRTVLMDASTRQSHADWRGVRWDYSGAMRDRLFYRVGDTAPSVFSFPAATTALDNDTASAAGRTEVARVDETPDRPPSAMSTASAPAALSAPRSRRRSNDGVHPVPDEVAEQGWIVACTPADADPFAPAADDHMDDERDEDEGAFLRALCEATALMTCETIRSPSSCGALLDFQARLRSLDPHGNFAAHCPAGDSAAAELQELRQTVEKLAAAQRETADNLRVLMARETAPPAAGPRPCANVAQEAPALATGQASVAVAGAATHKGARTSQSARQTLPTQAQHAAAQSGPAAADTTHGIAQPSQGKAVGRHDERRAVFCPATPFGGRMPAPASAGSVRRLNLASYQVRDAVNAALRDGAVAQMDESAEPVQVAGVNWTERGNLCMIVCEGFSSAHLLQHADVAAAAAKLGPGWKASRDVPVHKAVLRNVPTQRVDGTLFAEDDVLGDLRAHSLAFRSLTLADSAEPASWISLASVRVLKERSTMVLNLASAEDASRFLAMQRRLFVFGCPCEPGEFQPRDRERICRNCWNPLARHRERDFVCRERCRLCGAGHAEEDHACLECDVLSRPCEHIPLKCVNCGLKHSADDGVCEYRRRVRGTGPSAPPMSERVGGKAGSSAPAVSAKKKGKRVRVLDPHEPFPDDAVPTLRPPPVAPARTPPSPTLPVPTPQAAGETGPGSPRRKRVARKRQTARAQSANSTADETLATLQTQLAAIHAPAGSLAERTVPTQPPDAKHESVQSPELDFPDGTAVRDLVGDSQTTTVGAAAPRRVLPPRGAAAEADKEARRRRAAHVLVRAFGFLKLADAVTAIRKCSDDYASAVSWAAEEQASRRKPDMQGKSVEDMTSAAAKDKPAKGTDTTPAPVDA